MSRRTRSDLLIVGILWVLLSVLGEAGVSYVVEHYPLLASRQADITGDAVFFLLRITVPVFVLITLIVVYSAVRYRTAADDGRDSPSQYRSGRAFAWGWLWVSVALNLLFIVHPGITGLRSLWAYAASADDPLEVNVTARQWEWRFDYPTQGLHNRETLVVPVDRPVRFRLHSEDVVHSFWVPAWGTKMAVMPGETRTLVVTPDRIASTAVEPTVRLQCAQICGVGHAEMRAEVRVVSAGDFNRWVAMRGQGAGMAEGMGAHEEGDEHGHQGTMQMHGDEAGTEGEAHESGSGGMQMNDAGGTHQ
jgi:cytochrome c oxidase subunit 2